MRQIPRPKSASPAQDAVDAVTLTPTIFFVRKKAVRPMVHALTGTQPNPYQPNGALGLQDRTDLSGKFSRRLGAIRRALAKGDNDVIEDRKELTARHAERFPDFEADGVTPHPRAGEPTPVYATDPQTGAPLFKKDKAGNDTDERIIVPDQYNLADPMAFDREFKAMLEEFIAIECVGFTEDDFNGLRATPNQVVPLGKVIDPLSDLLRGEETEATPAEQAAALRAKAESLMAEADRILTEDADVAGPIDSDTVAADEVDDAEGPTAP